MGKVSPTSGDLSMFLCHILNSVITTSLNTILVTGGAGFIGSNFVMEWLQTTDSAAVNLDLLTYAGNRGNLVSVDAKSKHIFVQGDVCDAELVGSLLQKHRPCAIVHFAAESHVDRSIIAPDAFLRTNIQGTFVLLDQAKKYWSGLNEADPRVSGSCTCPRTKSTVPSVRTTQHSARRHLTRPIALMPPQKQPPTIWSGRTSTPLGCPPSPRIVRITTGPFSFLKN